MFNTMNNSFAQVEFNSVFDPHTMGYPQDYIRYFLARFDAIYTLNQDTLLEQKYSVPDIHRLSGGRWRDLYCPGVEPVTVQGKPFEPPGVWKPQQGTLELELHRQPYFKLHGSSNWREGENSILIMGGNKTQSIDSHPLLKAYKDRLLADVSHSDTRLMIIGYSFRDAHINEIIYAGMLAGAKLFIVDPQGIDVARNAIRFPSPSNPTAFESLLPKFVLGGSRRPLNSTFSTDHVERAKLMRFLNG